MFTLCKSWMMEKSYNYKYPSVLECAQAVTMPCAKYFDKQTHSCAECNYVIFVLKKSEVKVVGIILLTSWLMVHHGCCTVVGGLLYGATRLIFRCRVQGKCSQTLNETQTEVLHDN